ncbi:unnamed protein product [Cladocopium goreaui]|uniref:RCC1 and BTB domain-containing protein 2 n=1 Tax=Cladocopium goreaui TaxID=2562237 RepID=A0A9P1D0T7_9DINO|nr:unnamed protein product [Cladocopium goreaui]
MASSSDRPGLPVVLGRTNPPTNSVKSNKSIKSQGPEKFNSERSVEAEQTELQDSEATCGQVFIAMNITRGMPWFRREKDPGWFVVGNRRVVERLNRDWLEKKHLQQLCEDITRLGKHHQLFEPEPYVLCKTEKYCGFCLFLVTAVLIIITVAWGALHKHQSNGLMVACGVLLAITTMCCCCMNVRRRRMMDWEVPITEIKRFATIWSKKYGFHLTFELHYDGPSYFILKPKQQASTKSGKDEEQMNQMV